MRTRIKSALNYAAGAVWVFFHPKCRRQRIAGQETFNAFQRAIECEIGWRELYTIYFSVMVDDANRAHEDLRLIEFHMRDLVVVEVIRLETAFASVLRILVADEMTRKRGGP